MAKIPGIQDPIAGNIISSLQDEIHQLWAEIQILKDGRRPVGSYIVKLSDDVSAPDVDFIFSVPIDVDGLRLENLEAFVSTAAGSQTQLDLHNLTQGSRMITDYLTIAGSQNQSNPAYILDNINRQVFWQDHLKIGLVTIPSAITGLGVHLSFQ